MEHVRYVQINNQTLISMVLNPQFYDMGLGYKIIGKTDRKFSQSKGGGSICAEILDVNGASIKALKKTGLRNEGVQLSQRPCNGKYTDGIVLAGIKPASK